MRLRRGSTAGLGMLAAAAVLVGACKQGPDFVSPAAPQEQNYTLPGDEVPPSADDPPSKRGPAQRVALGARIESDWWTLFHSPALNGVVKQALTDSPTIAQATATLAQAREQVLAAYGAGLPQIDLTAGIARQAIVVSPNGTPRAPEPKNVFSVGPTVSFAPDVFGSIQRQVEATAAQADLSDYQLAAAYLSLTGNIAIQAITIAGLRAQIKTVGLIIADDERNLNLVKTQQVGGTATMVDVTTAASQLANDRTLLPPLRQQLSIARDALAVFVGRAPADWVPPDFDLKDLTLPGVVPLSLPSALVRQRPDILAAEAQLHANAALVGVAVANLYPNFTLSASIAQQATAFNNVFSAFSNGWLVAANMSAPIYHGGTLEAQKRAAEHAFDAAWAAYRQTVIQSFGQVADQLHALAHDDEFVKTERAALASTVEALRLARLSYAAGNLTLLQLLDPERQMQQAQLGLVKAETQRLLDTAQLMVALGSGWWNTPPTVPTADTKPEHTLPVSPTISPAPATVLPPGEAEAGPFWDKWFK